MRKGHGPNFQPCRTPARISGQSENWPLKTTFWCLSSRKLRDRFRRFPDIPRNSSLYSNPSPHTLANALEMSKKLLLTSSDGLWSKSAQISCTIDISSYMDESLEQKPDWYGVSSSLFSRLKNTGLYIYLLIFYHI